MVLELALIPSSLGRQLCCSKQKTANVLNVRGAIFCSSRLAVNQDLKTLKPVQKFKLKLITCDEHNLAYNRCEIPPFGGASEHDLSL